MLVFVRLEAVWLFCELAIEAREIKFPKYRSRLEILLLSTDVKRQEAKTIMDWLEDSMLNDGGGEFDGRPRNRLNVITPHLGPF